GDEHHGSDDEEADGENDVRKTGERAHEALEERLLRLARGLGVAVAEKVVDSPHDGFDLFGALDPRPDHPGEICGQPFGSQRLLEVRSREQEPNWIPMVLGLAPDHPKGVVDWRNGAA